MDSRTRVLVRMRDAGMALKVARNFGRWLSRTQLQKFIYLLDIISLLYDLLPPSEAHRTYKYGPYDVAIQNAIDSLSFRGFVTVYDVHRSPDGDVSSRYQLTPEGNSWIEEISEMVEFVSRWKAASAVGRQINKLGWERIVNLVYAEPTFVSMRNRGYGQTLPVNNGINNSAAFFMASINRVLCHGFEKISINPDLIPNLFFRYLAEYDHLLASKGRRRYP